MKRLHFLLRTNFYLFDARMAGGKFDITGGDGTQRGCIMYAVIDNVSVNNCLPHSQNQDRFSWCVSRVHTNVKESVKDMCSSLSSVIVAGRGVIFFFLESFGFKNPYRRSR